jgi:hypothetical protein
MRVLAIRWSIETLGAQKIHSTFLMYLYLRMKARQGALAEASPSSDEVRSLMRLPGNPEKPYYLPMLDRADRTETLHPSFWHARNIAGSWSVATLRRSPTLNWLADANGYFMPGDNAQQAFERLLFGQRVSAVAMAGFFLRDEIFAKEGTPTFVDLIDTFRGRFDFTAADEDDFLTLFDPDPPKPPAPDNWFEHAPSNVVEDLIG